MNLSFRKLNLVFLISLFILGSFILVLTNSLNFVNLRLFFSQHEDEMKTSYDDAILNWEGYKHFFIAPNGRVIRPLNGNDTVSEGQAYAMLRAVWLNDKDTFDRCYHWTETHLNRRSNKGDSLLAWNWKDGSVVDWMPASDADIDYALSLIFADALWGDDSLKNFPSYKARALELLGDIVNHLVLSNEKGEVFLLPWIIQKNEAIPINISYYSPAHFQIFYNITGNEIWLKLREASYTLLFKSLSNFNGENGIGLIPDWMEYNSNGLLTPLKGKDPSFGWESVRIPFRFYLDYEWFNNEQAQLYFSTFLGPFIENEFRNQNKVYSEYSYNGKALNPYESSPFYAAYSLATTNTNHDLSNVLLKKAQSYLKLVDGKLVYEDEKDYYRNSLAWITSAQRAGILKNLTVIKAN